MRGVREEYSTRGKRSVLEKGKENTEGAWWGRSPLTTTTTSKHVGTKQGYSEEPKCGNVFRLQNQRLASNPSSVLSVLCDLVCAFAPVPNGYQSPSPSWTAMGTQCRDGFQRCLSVPVRKWLSFTSCAPERPAFSPMVPPSIRRLVLQAKVVAWGSQSLSQTSLARRLGYLLCCVWAAALRVYAPSANE